MNRNELYHYGVKGMKWHKHLKAHVEEDDDDDEELTPSDDEEDEEDDAEDEKPKRPHSRKRNNKGKTGTVKRDDESLDLDLVPVGTAHGHGQLPGVHTIRDRKGRRRNYQGKSAEVKVKVSAGYRRKGPVSGRRRKTSLVDLETLRKTKRKKAIQHSRLYSYDSSDELYHYGVVGMKWGVRRYQNSDGSLTDAGKKRQARLYSKELNAKDKSMVKDKRAIKDAERSARLAETAAKYTRSESRRKTLNYTAKQKRESVNENRKNVEKTEKEIKKLVDKIKKDGYSVNSKEVKRNANEGRDWATSAALTAVAYTVASATAAPYALLLTPGHTVQGTKYKVRG